MGLKEYRAKRNFKASPEPKGRGKSDQPQLIFVVQKHDATHLHYDFRLEHRGVLLSWAVPKGPSKTKGEKRLAIQVEDHPLEYADFEGEIPAGNYGAGTVEIWDRGTYLARDASDAKESEAHIRQGLKKGHLALVLKGKKLKGNYDLIRFRREGKKAMWFLIKTSPKD